MCLPVDSVFEFSQIGHHDSERWSFSKEHLSPVSVIDSNQREVRVRRAYPMAPRCSEIVPRRSFLKENLLALHHACRQAKIFHRKLAVLVPIYKWARS